MTANVPSGLKFYPELTFFKHLCDLCAFVVK